MGCKEEIEKLPENSNIQNYKSQTKNQ